MSTLRSEMNVSETSDSFHLRTDDPSAAEALLLRAGVRGAILLPVEGPFVAFLVDAESDPLVVANNTGLLIRYWFAEDYGCWIRVYDGPHQIAELAYENELAKEAIPDDVPPEERQDRNIALEALARVGIIDEAALTTLGALDTQEQSSEWGPTVAAVLHLKPVEWLDGRNLAHPAQLFDFYPDTYLVEVQTESAE
jgi:hypothetical protein